MKLSFSFKPSLKSVAILFTMLVFFIAAWKSQVGILYLTIAFLMSLLIASVSIIILQIFSGTIEVKRQLRNSAIEGEDVDIVISITNNGIVAIYNLQVKDNFTVLSPAEKEALIFIENIHRHETIEVRYKRNCFKRGLYDIGPITLIFSGPFGLFFFSRQYPVFNSLLVYPETFRIHRFPKPRGRGKVSWYGIETTHISGDEHEFYGIREYRPKDRISNIHWRSSARLQKLIVKQFERCSESQLTIVIDLMKDNNIGSGKETTLEYAVKIAASLAKYLIENKYSVQLLLHWNKMVHIPFGREQSHLSRILNLLAMVKADSNVPLSELLTEAAPLIPAHSELLLIMTDTDLRSLRRAIDLVVKNVSIRPFVLFSSSFAYFAKEEDIKERVKAKQIETFSSSKIIPHFFYCGDNLETKFQQTVR